MTGGLNKVDGECIHILHLLLFCCTASKLDIITNNFAVVFICILDECKDLAGDVMFLATKFIPQKRVGEALLEEGNVHAAIVKTEDCR